MFLGAGGTFGSLPNDTASAAGSNKTGGDKEDKNGTSGGDEPDAGGSSKGGSGGSDFAKKGLAMHNAFRKIHGVPDMKLDDKMTEGAQEYANLLAKIKKLQFGSSNYGENLAVGCADNVEMSAQRAVRDW